MPRIVLTLVSTALMAAMVFPSGAATAADDSTPVVAQDRRAVDARLDELFGSHKPVAEFLAMLQRAVAAGNRQEVASLIEYPLQTRIAGHSVTLRNANQLTARYDALFTPRVITAIRDQTYAELFVRDQGVAIGSGQLWFSGVCNDEHCRSSRVRITAINP